MDHPDRSLTAEQHQALMEALQARFEKNRHRHKGSVWAQVQGKLEAGPEKLWSLYQMEQTGGEPDVIGTDEKGTAFLFCDCSAESPAGRRNLCYDNAALESRKKNKPRGSALAMADSMGVALLTEEQYRALQGLEAFDTKTSSWVFTPQAARERGGAFFCDRRYDHVFLYHNGAESYYAARGFRASLWV